MKLIECLRTNDIEFSTIFYGITYVWKQENFFCPHLMSPIRINGKEVIDKYLLKQLWELDTWDI